MFARVEARGAETEPTENGDGAIGGGPQGVRASLRFLFLLARHPHSRYCAAAVQFIGSVGIGAHKEQPANKLAA